MKNKQNERKAKATLLALLMLMVIVLPFVSCDEEEEPPESVASTSFGVPVYAGTGATNAEAKAKITEIDTVYGHMSLNAQNTLKTKITKIVIVGGAAYSTDKPNKTINLGKDASEDTIIDCFSEMLAKVIDNSRNTVRMAKAFVIGNAKSI
jgi:hypothetical protein